MNVVSYAPSRYSASACKLRHSVNCCGRERLWVHVVVDLKKRYRNIRNERMNEYYLAPRLVSPASGPGHPLELDIYYDAAWRLGVRWFSALIARMKTSCSHILGIQEKKQRLWLCIWAENRPICNRPSRIHLMAYRRPINCCRWV